MEIRLNKRSCFYILLTVLCVLLAVRYAFGIELPRMVLTAIVIAMGMIGDHNETLAIAMGCIPLHQAIDFYIAVVALAGILLLKNLHQIRIGFPVILVLLMIVWELFHCFVFKWSLLLLLTSLAPLVFIAVVMSVRLKDVDYAFITRIMSLLSIWVCALLLMNCIVRADGNLMGAFVNMSRLGTVSEGKILLGGAINPNSIGIVNVLCVAALLQVRATGERKKLDIVYIFALLIFGVLTLSKTFLACLLILLILLLIDQKTKWTHKLRIIGGALICGIVLIFVINLLFPEVIESFIKRFQVKDITTGRIDIMGVYHRFITEHPVVPLFGIGLSDFGEKVLNVYQVSIHVPHNSIQEIIVAWGIPGLLMIATLIWVEMVEAKRSRGARAVRLLNYIPLLIILAKSMAGQLLTSGYTMLALGLAYLSLCQDFSNKRAKS